jgi:SAM-dependent methyltransferase
VRHLLRRAARQAVKPLAWGHYRFLFGRRFPGSGGLDRWLAAWEGESARGDLPLPREAWDEQYRGGRWDCLGEAGELARYGVIAALLRRHCPRGRLLDVGCGEGLLLAHFQPGEGGSYLGIDLSVVAIERAAERHGGPPRFAVADAGSFRPEGPLDAVVLNECLYYLREPVAQAERYLGMLAPGGILIVSMFRTPRTRALSRALAAARPPEERLELRSARGRWQIAVYRRDGC